jgi:hypothetical protein
MALPLLPFMILPSHVLRLANGLLRSFPQSAEVGGSFFQSWQGRVGHLLFLGTRGESEKQLKWGFSGGGAGPGVMYKLG